MPYVFVTADRDDVPRDARVVHWERVNAADFNAEHYARCFAERIGWAAADAERGDLPQPETESPAERSRRFARV